MSEDNWKHKSTGMRCRTCMWFVSKSNQQGRCRKHAPTLNGWPVVYESDWCGDHKLDSEAGEQEQDDDQMKWVSIKDPTLWWGGQVLDCSPKMYL